MRDRIICEPSWERYFRDRPGANVLDDATLGLRQVTPATVGKRRDALIDRILLILKILKSQAL